jgi:ATP-dependent phosphoenolpyruvate carboxykinase
MLKQKIILPVAAALFMCASAAFAEQKLDIIQIMGQFVQARYAASQCLKPDQDTISRFNSNFRIVSIRATEEMLKRRPGSTETQVSVQFKKGTDTVQKQIDEVIRTKGCGDSRIQDILKLFEIQANLKL